MSEGVGFGNYRLLRRLARGGMAEVFLARQQGVEGFERRVAIKRILPHLSDSAEFRTMFLDEARLAAQLSHPNIIHIYDFGKVDDYYFIAMEYVEGVDLGRLIKQARTSPVPFELIARLLADACAGLQYAHNITDGAGTRLKVVHRDVTPQNVLVTYDGIVKVVDFGIAKATWQASRTRPGVVKGKYAYMSPEQVEGRPLDARSDIFSVGICMYELMTGMPLYRRDNVTEAMKEIRDGKPIHPENHRSGIPAELMAVLKRALETSRDARYESAAAMQLDLERYLKAATELATPQLLGDFVRRESPPGPQGEALFESKDQPVLPEAARASEPLVKGGTAQMSSVKQAITPAYENVPLLSNAAALAIGATSTGGSARRVESNEDLTTPGKPNRTGTGAAPRTFASEDEDDLTRRDDRMPEPPIYSGEQATVRSSKIDPSLEATEISRPERSVATSDRRSGNTSAQPRSGQHERVQGSRSAPFPSGTAGPLGAGVSREVSASSPLLSGEPTSALHSPPPRRRRWVPWAVIGGLVVLAGLAVALRPHGTKPHIDPVNAHVDDPTHVDPRPDPNADAKNDAGPQVITTELPVQTSATLGLNTRPSGAKVFIDGEPLEMLTPVRTLPVTAGPHHVVIERTGYQPREVDISLHAGEHRVLEFELPEEHSLQGGGGKKKTAAPHPHGSGFLTVKTVPSSRAFDGSQLLGETPLVNVPLSDGLHTLTFVGPDGKSVKKKLVVHIGEETRLSFSLGEP
ncbi:MAG: protein kinase [Polyangia bacterium]